MLKLAYNMFAIFQNSRSIYAFAPMSGPTVQQLIPSIKTSSTRKVLEIKSGQQGSICEYGQAGGLT